MALVGSLVFFLIQVFYRGPFAGRMEYIFALFVFAAVLIARISIDEGREYSTLYAIPLALAMLLVLGRFTSSAGLFNILLIGVVWWCADKLTWDCTVIDEREDASGEGLLQTAGLESAPDSSAAASSAPASDLEATTSRGRPPEPKSLWERFVEHRKRPHAPGVWVIYFSLAALPLFGIGQRFIPATELDARRYAFKLLCIYTASGLGLLMTTSFLGLRRYLRQRRLEMPVEMAGVWLTVGSVMIAALLFVCWLLPRPSAEYSITQVPFQVGSPADRQASRHGWGNEGARDQDRKAPATAAAGKTQKGRPGGQESQGHSDQTPAQDAPGTGKSPGGTQGDGKQGAGTAGDGAQGGGKQADGKQANGQPAGQEQNQGSGAESKQGPSESSSGSEPADNGRQQGPKDPRGQPSSDTQNSRSGDRPPESSGEASESQSPSEPKPSDPPREARSADAKADTEARARSADTKADTEAQARSADTKADTEAQEDPFESEVDPREAPGGASRMPNPSELLNRVLGLVPHGLKWLYNLIFVAIVGYLVWRNRAQVMEALRSFWQAIRDFWDSLFGCRRAESAADDHSSAVTAPPPRPFADFPDPFVTGDARRWSPRELVAYSFQALEAWGREHGCQRGPEQTPHEFAGALAAYEATVGREATGLADLYCCAAYSSGSLPRDRVGRLQELWRTFALIDRPAPR
jgi:hypothetical protein